MASFSSPGSYCLLVSSFLDKSGLLLLCSCEILSMKKIRGIHDLNPIESYISGLEVCQSFSFAPDFPFRFFQLIRAGAKITDYRLSFTL